MAFFSGVSKNVGWAKRSATQHRKLGFLSRLGEAQRNPTSKVGFHYVPPNLQRTELILRKWGTYFGLGRSLLAKISQMSLAFD